MRAENLCMIFAAPWVLISLLTLPVLAVVYAWRRRRSATTVFASPHLVASVQPHRPRWRRTVLAGAVLVTLALLIVAAAQPQHSVAVTVDHASIMLATDVSGSMLATDVKPSRLAAAKDAGRRFVASVPSKVNVGVMAFNQGPSVLQSPTTDRQAIDRAISSMRASGTTASGDAVLAALRTLALRKTVSGKQAPAAIVLLSDGASTRGSDPTAAAKKAKAQHVPIYTIALGSSGGTITVKKPNGRSEVKRVPPAPKTLAAMSAASGGRTFAVADVDALKQVYGNLGSQLGHVQQTRPMTAFFAAAALFVLLASSAMSLRWFGRLI